MPYYLINKTHPKVLGHIIKSTPFASTTEIPNVCELLEMSQLKVKQITTVDLTHIGFFLPDLDPDHKFDKKNIEEYRKFAAYRETDQFFIDKYTTK